MSSDCDAGLPLMLCQGSSRGPIMPPMLRPPCTAVGGAVRTMSIHEQQLQAGMINNAPLGQDRYGKTGQQAGT